MSLNDILTSWHPFFGGSFLLFHTASSGRHFCVSCPVFVNSQAVQVVGLCKFALLLSSSSAGLDVVLERTCPWRAGVVLVCGVGGQLCQACEGAL